MSDILVRTAGFFLIPESVISVIFLVIFLEIFAFGVYRKFMCKEFLKTFAEGATENFKAVATKMTPETFIKKSLRKISVPENMIEELPNVFVSVGIVATFLGIGVAVQGTTALLQSNTFELQKLTAILSVIAFKFQTSIWGICFSLIFRNVVIERYFEFKRRLVEDITDRLSMLEGENVRTLIERQNGIIVAQHEALLAATAAQHEALLAATAAQNQALIEHLIAIESRVREDNVFTNGYLRYLAENLKAFVDVSENFAVNELAFSEQVKEFKEEFSKHFPQAFEDLKATNKEHIEKIHNENSKILEKLLGEIQSTFSKIEGNVDALNNEFTSNQNKFNDSLQISFSKLNDTMDKFIEKIDEASEKSNERLTAEQKKFYDKFQNSFSKINETMDKISKVSTAENERLETLCKTLSDVTQNLSKILTANDLELSLRKFDKKKSTNPDKSNTAFDRRDRK